MGMDWLIPLGSAEEQELDQWWQGALAGWARRQKTPANIWQRIQPGIQAGPARRAPQGTSNWADFIDVHTWVLLAGLCLVVAGLLLGMLSTPGTAGVYTGGPVGLDSADALSGRAVLLAERTQHSVWSGLSPAQDPLLLHRREGG